MAKTTPNGLSHRTPPWAPPQPRMTPAAPQMIMWPYQEERPQTTGTAHLHWGITAFHSVTEDGTMRDSLQIEVEAPDEESAIARAQEIIVRPYYRVSWVREACSTDPDLRRV